MMMAANDRKSMVRPQLILLKENTDVAQGKGHVLSNIMACMAICDVLQTTLGPRGMDKLIVDEKGNCTISNDGATIMNLLDITHPTARILVNASKAQDAEVGDGTTSVVLFAGELLKEAKKCIESGTKPNLIIQGYRYASNLALQKLKELSFSPKKDDSEEFRNILIKCAETSMNSKLIKSKKAFFGELVVDAVMNLNGHTDSKLIGVKKVTGGSLEDSMLIFGVSFKKTFSYAGFEQQPKKIKSPRILLLNIELEWKAERDNAEIRVDSVEKYKEIVDAEILGFYKKLDSIRDSGANVVLSKLPIGDLATQYFAEFNIVGIGRVPQDDMYRMSVLTKGQILSTLSGVTDGDLGKCEVFEEVQMGSERYNVFLGEKNKTTTSTLILRGGSEQLISEVERSIHDATCVVKRCMTAPNVVPGGGAIEMELSKHLNEMEYKVDGGCQLMVRCFSNALEMIPRLLCNNAGLNTNEVMSSLRKKHIDGGKSYGIDILKKDISDNYEMYVWEPSLIKQHVIQTATEAACLILSIDETIKAPSPPQQQY